MLRVVFLLTLAIHCASSAACELGWLENKGSCYSFNEESLTWTDAAALCLVYGARLIQIDSAEKNKWLGTTLESLSFDDVWVGGSARYHKDTWEWVPSRKLSKNYQNWAAGEPNNPQGEQCLEVSRGRQYQWNDKGCLNTLKSVCEKIKKEP